MKWKKFQNVIFQTFFSVILLLNFCDNQELSNPFDPASDIYIPPTQGLLIEDFDDGKDPNLLGGYSSVFIDPDGKAKVDTLYHNKLENVLRGVGYSMRIYFDVSKEGDPFGGYVQTLIDNSPNSSSKRVFNLESLKLDTLKFWVKAESAGINFEVALKDTNNLQTEPKLLFREYIANSIGLWKEIKIPIDSLKRIKKDATVDKVDLKILRELNFGFGKNRFEDVGADLKGIIYLDEISFER